MGPGPGGRGTDGVLCSGGGCVVVVVVVAGEVLAAREAGAAVVEVGIGCVAAPADEEAPPSPLAPSSGCFFLFRGRRLMNLEIRSMLV